MSRIFFKSCEIGVGANNIRAPYSFTYMLVSVNGITNNVTITLPNKSYNDISLFLADLNALLLSNITVNSGEICPQLYLKSTELGKVIIESTLVNTTMIFYNEGTVYYHLGTINPLIISKTLTSGTSYLNTCTLLYNYNLCFDNYSCMVINNLTSPTTNNHGTPCTFKININAATNSINYNYTIMYMYLDKMFHLLMFLI